jgi:hypothetical protein
MSLFDNVRKPAIGNELLVKLKYGNMPDAPDEIFDWIEKLPPAVVSNVRKKMGCKWPHVKHLQDGYIHGGHQASIVASTCTFSGEYRDVTYGIIIETLNEYHMLA